MKRLSTSTKLELLALALLAVLIVAAWELVSTIAQWIVYVLIPLGIAGVVVLLVSQWDKFKIYKAKVSRDKTAYETEEALMRQNVTKGEIQLDAEKNLADLLPDLVQSGTVYPSHYLDMKLSHFPHIPKEQVIIGDGVPLLGEPVAPEVIWPEKVDLFDLLPNRAGNTDNIILGRTCQFGREGTISIPLERMMHTVAGGDSGTGKSSVGSSIAYQLLTAPQEVKLVMADPAETTWKLFDGEQDLMLPIISSETDLLYGLKEVETEMYRRTREVYKPYPQVEKLSDYNQMVDNPLPYIVVFVDEFPWYMEHGDISQVMSRLIWTARKAGIYFFGMGTTWRSKDFNISIREQFKTRIHFSTTEKASSRILLDSPVATELNAVGRAFIKMPQRILTDLIEVQVAYIDKGMLIETRQGSIFDNPVVGPSMAEAAALKANKEGKSLRECYRIWWSIEKGELWPKGKTIGGNQVQVVKEIIQKWGSNV